MGPEDAKTTAQRMRAALPEPIGARVQTLRAGDTGVQLVLDASGLGESERTALESEARRALRPVSDGRDIRIALTAERVGGAPVSEPSRPPRLIAIASGKGGVGKSTLTANLAVAMKRAGARVGVVDADIYGPSQPTLLASEGARPEAVDKRLTPVTGAHDIPMLSVGHLVTPGRALAWRGPMATGALGQLIEADWTGVDTLLVDLPPGTGDVQLTMIRKYTPAGAILVSTPQDLALIDAARAGQLFDQTDVPVIGLVENMAGYVCPHCGEASDPFGRGGVETIAQRLALPFLGRIPLALAIREASDAGTPPAGGDGPLADAYAAIAAQLSAWLATRPAES